MSDVAIEIERKFLVADDSWRRDVTKTHVLKQGYLGGERCSVRVRIQDDSANLNIKSREIGPQRDEYEYAIPLPDAESMLDTLCIGFPVEKTRHLVPFGGHVWEVDEFGGANAGLVVAEVELNDPDEDFERPPWLGREVTREERYYNVWLSGHPYRDW